MATTNQLIVKLDKLANIDLTKGLTKACLLVEGAAKEKCPINTGNLRNSITFEINGDTGVVGTNKEYAP